MTEIERISAMVPISSELLADVTTFREGLDAALRGELPPSPPRPVPTTPAGHLALLDATDGTLRAVVDLHGPRLNLGIWWRCEGCDIDGYDADYPPWPCSTVALIAEQMGVELREASDGQ